MASSRADISARFLYYLRLVSHTTQIEMPSSLSASCWRVEELLYRDYFTGHARAGSFSEEGQGRGDDCSKNPSVGFRFAPTVLVHGMPNEHANVNQLVNVSALISSSPALFAGIPQGTAIFPFLSIYLLSFVTQSPPPAHTRNGIVVVFRMLFESHSAAPQVPLNFRTSFHFVPVLHLRAAAQWSYRLFSPSLLECANTRWRTCWLPGIVTAEVLFHNPPFVRRSPALLFRERTTNKKHALGAKINTSNSVIIRKVSVALKSQKKVRAGSPITAAAFIFSRKRNCRLSAQPAGNTFLPPLALHWVSEWNGKRSIDRVRG